MVTNSAHFMATHKLAMKQGLLEGQTRAQWQADFTITCSTKELEHSTLVLAKTSPNTLLWCYISLLQSQANKNCATLGPFFLQTLHSLLLHQIETYLVTVHNETRNTLATQWTSQYLFLHKSNHLETPPMASLKVIFQFLSNHLKIIPITIGNNLQTYDGKNLPMIGQEFTFRKWSWTLNINSTITYKIFQNVKR